MQDVGQGHRNKELESAWKSAAVFLPILSDQNWNFKTDGMSLSSWIFLVDRPKKPSSSIHLNPEWRPDLLEYTTGGIEAAQANEDRDVHLFSFGSKNCLLEFWANSSAENPILVRLTQSTHSTSFCLGLQHLDLKIPAAKWNHLAVNCRQKLLGNQIIVHIHVILNGCQQTTLEMNVTNMQTKRVTSLNSFLLIGIASGKDDRQLQSSWYLGHMTLYKGEILTCELAFLLMALGPDLVFLASCQDHQLRPNFPRYLHPKLIGCHHDWDRLFNYGKLVPLLQGNVILTYSAHKPDSVFIYPCIISPTAGVSRFCLRFTIYDLRNSRVAK